MMGRSNCVRPPFAEQAEIMALEDQNLVQESVRDFVVTQNNPELALERLFCVPLMDKTARKMGRMPADDGFDWADKLLEASKSDLLATEKISTDSEWREYKAKVLRDFQSMYRSGMITRGLRDSVADENELRALSDSLVAADHPSKELVIEYTEAILGNYKMDYKQKKQMIRMLGHYCNKIMDA
eukprot:scaffold3296_cov405-Prasinococcus_capsulatus_cf.AAC.17